MRINAQRARSPNLFEMLHFGYIKENLILRTKPYINLTAITIILTITTLCTTAAETPPWVESNGTCAADYPPERFVTGFGVSTKDRKMPKHEKISYAENAARVNLALALNANIEAETIIDNFSTMVDGDEQLVEEYKAKSVTRSDLNLDGINTSLYWQKESHPAYALAFLDKVRAREHYAVKFRSKMKILAEMQSEGNRQLDTNQVSMARGFYIKCENLVDEIEEIIVIQDILGGPSPLTENDLKRIVEIKATSRRLWRKKSETLEDAADQIALKLARQITVAGKVQINALMLEDAYQYSQFSGRFRTILERAISEHTLLTPINVNQQDFTPDSSRISRHGVAANGADYLLSGSYFVKEDGIHMYIKLIDTKTSTVVGTANAHAMNIAVKNIAVKPRNYLQALQDRKIFKKNEMVGGSILLETWTSRGIDGLVLEDGDELKIMVRVNQPIYLRFIYHLNNGARVIPDRLYMNYYIGTDKVNRVVELPDTFEICAPFGSETIQMLASNKRFPPVELVDRKFEGEVYEVIAATLEESNTLYRGLKRKKKEVEMDEVRIPLTTIAK